MQGHYRSDRLHWFDCCWREAVRGFGAVKKREYIRQPRLPQRISFKTGVLNVPKKRRNRSVMTLTSHKPFIVIVIVTKFKSLKKICMLPFKNFRYCMGISSHHLLLIYTTKIAGPVCNKATHITSTYNKGTSQAECACFAVKSIHLILIFIL